MTQDRASGCVCASLPRGRRASQHPASDYTLNREEPNKDLALEVSELVADLDKVSAEKDAAITELTARITALETQAAAMEAQLEQARAAEQRASSTAAEAAARLAASEARADSQWGRSCHSDVVVTGSANGRGSTSDAGPFVVAVTCSLPACGKMTGCLLTISSLASGHFLNQDRETPICGS